MNWKKLCLPVAAFLTCVTFGQDETEAARPEASQLRLEITNALIQEIRNTKEVRYRVRWHYLPDIQPEPIAETIIRVGNNSRSEVDEIVIKNKDFRDANLETFITQKLEAQGKDKAKERAKWERFLRALSSPVGSYAPTKSLRAALKSGRNYWKQPLLLKLFGPDFEGEEMTSGSDVSWYTLMAAQQSFFAMDYLFGYESYVEGQPDQSVRHTNGAGLIVEAHPSPRGLNPRTLVDELEWHIRIKTTRIPRVVEDPVPPVDPDDKLGPRKTKIEYDEYHTFAVSVITPEIRQTLRDAAETTSLKLNVVAGMLRAIPDDPRTPEKDAAYLMRHPADFETAAEVPDIPDPVKNLPDFKDGLGASIGSFVIGNATGGTASATSLLSPLFDNNSDAFPFYGTLVGAGKSAPMYGLNYVLSANDKGSLGFLYGFVANDSSDLFLGPSLTWGPFTVSAGARVFNREDDAVTARWGGGISVDIDRLFNPDKSQIVEPKPEANVSYWPKLSRGEKLLFLEVMDVPAGTTFTIKKNDKFYATYTVRNSSEVTARFMPISYKDDEIITLHAPAGVYLHGIGGDFVDHIVINVENSDGRAMSTRKYARLATLRRATGDVVDAVGVATFTYLDGMEERIIDRDGDVDFVVDTLYKVDVTNDYVVVVSIGTRTLTLRKGDSFKITADQGNFTLIKTSGTSTETFDLGTASEVVTFTVKKP